MVNLLLLLQSVGNVTVPYTIFALLHHLNRINSRIRSGLAVGTGYFRENKDNHSGRTMGKD